MKMKELENKSVEVLKAELARLNSDIDTKSIKMRTGQVKNVREVSGLKKDRARILSALHILK